MTVEKSNKEDSEILTVITKKSKAHWGYSDEQMNIWSELLTISESYIETNSVYKFIVDDKIIGYYSYRIAGEDTVKLDNLFLLPDFIGKGFGKVMMHDFLMRLKNTTVKNIMLDSDPHAENFYAKFGFVKTGQLETSIKDRYLPIMELKLPTG